MPTPKRGSWLLLPTLGAVLLSALGCSTAQQARSEKIPITTASAEARESYLKARELQENLRITEARALYEKAVAADANFALGHLGLSNTATSPEDFLAEVGKAVALSEKVSEGERLWIQATDAGARGNTAESLRLFRRLATAFPNDERAHFLLAGVYFGQQDYPSAIAEYRQAVAINPNYAAPYNQMGYALRFTGKYEEAEKTFQKYTELIPNDPNPEDSYAELLLALGRHDESVAHYRKALANDPNFTPSYIGIATNLNLQGKHDEARTVLAEMMGKARNDGERRGAHFAAAVSYADEGNLNAAIEEMYKLHAIAEKNGNTIQMAQDLNGVGLLLLEAGKTREAQAAFEKSVAMRMEADIPQSAKEQAQRDRFNNGARVALKKGDRAGAKSQAEEFRKLAEPTGNANQVRLYHELVGMIALEEKKYDVAVQELQQANQLNPYNLYRLALAHRSQGNKEKAKEVLGQIATQNPLNNLNLGLVRNRSDRILASL